ncbi:response regulator [Candidatus Magnetaquicoccus inordinatus]|uniref:response regulator n=1 Tax=Candidatus Magnetaquicoccus inordinatus TaxID=2496818 RepID=UPI00102C54E2|nr:response regulator [Candidatus Magnetaquicoccus inordinatus]
MSKKRALVVDDSSLARMMVRKIFSTRFTEWELLEAKDGEEALAVAGGEIHLALLDFNMPGMNGIELAEKLMVQYPGIALYLVTANIQERMQQKADALGIGFIKKPIAEHKLVEIMG